MRGRLALERDGHDVVEFENGPDLLDHLASLLSGRGRQTPDVIITEHKVGLVSALTVSRSLRAAGWSTALVVISGDVRFAQRAKPSFAVLRPSADSDDLRMTVMNLSA